MFAWSPKMPLPAFLVFVHFGLDSNIAAYGIFGLCTFLLGASKNVNVVTNKLG